MIFDFIHNKENYKDYPLLYQALEYLATLETNELPAPNTILVPERLFCNPVELTSKPEEACIYEAHRKYIDLHYIVEGLERIGTADITSLSTTADYSEEKDIEFLEGTADGYYNLTAGKFMVCFPNDAHKVAIMHEEPVDIKKVVFKIAVED